METTTLSETNMMHKSPDETSNENIIAKGAVLGGWILIVLNILCLLGLLTEKNAVGNLSVLVFIRCFPDVDSEMIIKTVGSIIRLNMFNIPSLILGVYAYRNGNKKGRALIFISVMIFIAFTLLLFIQSAHYESGFEWDFSGS